MNRQNPFQMVINEIKFVKGLTNFIFFVRAKPCLPVEFFADPKNGALENK